MVILSFWLVLGGCGSGSEGETKSVGKSNWWEVDGTTSEVSTGNDGTDKKTTDAKGDKDKFADEKTEKVSGRLLGRLDSNTGVGTINVQTYQSDDQIDCDASFVVSAPTQLDSCVACVFAWQFTAGEATLIVNNDGCESFATGVVGKVYGFGHGEQNDLYFNKDAEWFVLNQSSQLEGTTWTFSFAY